MDDVRARYMMSGTCPTGGPKNILRYAGTIAEDDVQVLTDEGGGNAKAVDSRGDVPDDEGAVDNDEVATQGQEVHGGRGNEVGEGRQGFISFLLTTNRPNHPFSGPPNYSN